MTNLKSRRWKPAAFISFSFAILLLAFNNCQGTGFQTLGMEALNSSQDLGSSPPPDDTKVPENPPTPIVSDGKIGWIDLPNSSIATVLPLNRGDLNASGGPRGIVNAWNGGVADTQKNRLIVWGGGHNDYFGNELYALEVASGTMTRITEPSPVDAIAKDPNRCPEVYSDGGPVSRHTYAGQTFVPTTNSMYTFSGSKAQCGYGSSYTWLFDFGKMSWAHTDPADLRPPGGYGVVADYDPNSQKVIITATDDGVWSFDPISKVYLKLASGARMDYHLTGAIAPERKIMLLVGPKNIDTAGMRILDISADGGYKVTNITSQTSGCDGLMVNSPGLAYDPIQKVFVGWPNKGGTVYLFDPDTKICTTKSFTGGPSETENQSNNGTFGRFRYFPAHDVFALVYNTYKNAILLKLR